MVFHDLSISLIYFYGKLGIDEMDFNEASKAVIDLISDYQMYENAAINVEVLQSLIVDIAWIFCFIFLM